ncbi:MAG: heavy metal-associated domain-containing protein [Candidatus Eisenbacteria bacterium]
MKSDALNIAAIVVGVLLLAIGGPWLVRELGSLPAPAALAARGNHRIVTLEVGGMTCEGCAGAVKGQLAGVSGVSAVDVRVTERRAYVVCQPNVADSSLTAAVRRAGRGFVASVGAR